MTREDIIKLAQEAGWDMDDTVDGFSVRLERFAALVAAVEREKVAAWMIQRSYATGHGDTTEDLLKELDWQIDERIAAEREACAKVCEETTAAWTQHLYNSGCVDCAVAIRARGQG